MCWSCSKKIYRKDKSTVESPHGTVMLASLWFVTSAPWCPFISHWVRRTRKRERSTALQVKISLTIRIEGTMWTLISNHLQRQKTLYQCSETTGINKNGWWDGNGLQLESVRPPFSSSTAVSWNNPWNLYLWFTRAKHQQNPRDIVPLTVVQKSTTQ